MAPDGVGTEIEASLPRVPPEMTDAPDDASRSDDRSDTDRPKRPTPARRSGGGDRKGRPKSARPEAARPTPVRQSVAAERVELPDPERPTREVEHDGTTWIVEVAGRSLSGARTDASALILLLTFRRADADTPEREALCAYPGLDAISEHRLVELLERGEAYRGSGTQAGDEDLFEGTRRRREPRGS